MCDRCAIEPVIHAADSAPSQQHLDLVDLVQGVIGLMWVALALLTAFAVGQGVRSGEVHSTQPRTAR